MKINFYTQDPSVFPAIPLTLSSNKVGKGPSDSRIQVCDRTEFSPAVADKNGNFLYKPGEPQFDSCQVYAVLKLGLDLYSRILNRTIPFAFSGKVTLYPHFGPGFNAYYDRRDHGVHFLEMSNPAFRKALHKETLQMSESLDVAAHESVGHLLLDGLKPHYMNLELESQAFHEAFGDISAMITALQFDQVIDQLLSETKGNLRESNVISRLAEEPGVALQAMTGKDVAKHHFLRDACYTLRYNWKYQEPDTLEDWSPQNEKHLGGEPHNFSRFFAGTWYEVFATLFEKDPQAQSNPKQAILNARDVATRLILRAVADFSPDTTGRFEDIAAGMLKADQVDYHGAHQNLLFNIFKSRKILDNASLTMLSHLQVRLRKSIRSRHEAAEFLRKNRHALGIPSSISLEPARDFPGRTKRFVYTNKNGETFLTYHATQRGTLSDSAFNELQGAEYEFVGSLKLAFDKKGRMIDVSSDLEIPHKHRRIQSNLQRLHENDMIKLTSSVGDQEELFKSHGDFKVPYFAHITFQNGEKLIKRVPIFV